MNEQNARDIMFSTHTTALAVTPAGKGLLHEAATWVKIDDEGGGPFIVIEQGRGQVAIEPDEWPAIRDAVEQLLGVCDKLERK